MYLLIEDPEWLQLRQEEILATEDYNRDRELLLWATSHRADQDVSEEELRGYAKRFKESVLQLEDVQRQMAHLHQTYSAKVEVYKSIARQVEEATSEVAALVPSDHLPLDFPDTLWPSQTLADCGREVSRVAQEFEGFEGLV